jgi:hypothetical protein
MKYFKRLRSPHIANFRIPTQPLKYKLRDTGVELGFSASDEVFPVAFGGSALVREVFEGSGDFVEGQARNFVQRG